MCLLLLSKQKHKRFFQKLVTSDEKLIDPKRRKHWGGQSTSTQKRNVLIYIWWDEWDVLCYELLKPGETITGKHYNLQLNYLAEKIQKKRPYTGRGHRPVILQHNAKPHTSSGVLLHPAYSPDIAPCDYHLFRSLQNSLAEQQFKMKLKCEK